MEKYLSRRQDRRVAACLVFLLEYSEQHSTFQQSELSPVLLTLRPNMKAGSEATGDDPLALGLTEMGRFCGGTASSSRQLGTEMVIILGCRGHLQKHSG